MREINLKPYKFSTPDGWKDYDVKQTLVVVLFAGGVPVREAIERDKIARGIESAGDSILLEEEEWNRCVKAIDSLKDITRYDIECMKRVLDAPKVEVEKKSGEPRQV